MAIQGESLFALIRRRESIRALAQHKHQSLPSSLKEDTDESYGISPETPAQKLQRDLAKLDAKKKEHLVVPRHKGGGKLNRLSYIGLFIGLMIAGSIFFIAGYLMCLSVNPPNGGIMFESKFATAPVGKPLSTSINQLEENLDVIPDVPQKSYVDRQALLARTGGRSERKGLLQQSEERTYNNVKNQIKDNISQGLRSLSQRISDKLSPGISNIVTPITNDLPQQLARNNLNDTFNQSNNSALYDSEDSEATELGSKSPSDTLGNKDEGDISQPPSSTLQKKATQISSSQKSVSKAQPNRALYAIRVSRFVERDSALKLAEELDRKGYNSYIVPIWNNGGLDFEVRSGAYATYSQAQDAARVLQQVWQGPGIELPSVVMTRRQEENIKP